MEVCLLYWLVSVLNTTHVLRAALVGAAALILASCGGDDEVPETAATINGVEISSAAVESQAEFVMADPTFQQEMEGVDSDEAQQQQARVRALNQLISEVALEQGAGDLGVEVTAEDVDEVRADIVAAQFGDEDEMYDQLAEQGMDRDEVDRQLRLVAIQDAVVNELSGDITDADIEAAYDEGTPARHILVESESDADEALDRIRGGEDFADVAQDVSIDGSAPDGGNLGFVQAGTTVPEFEDALFDADDGEVVGPVESQFGFHVIERLDKPDLAEVEDELRMTLEQQALQEGQLVLQNFIGEQMQVAEVTVDPFYGSWDADTGRVVPDDEPLED